MRSSGTVLVAAVQIYIEHGTVVTQEDLKVGLQAGCAFDMLATMARLRSIPSLSLILLGACSMKPLTPR